MTIDGEWSAAGFQPECVVMRLRLRPYSCGHEILLAMIDSPIVGRDEAEWTDLAAAALICSQKFESALDLVRNPAKFRFFIWLWRVILSYRLDLRRELLAFRSYLYNGKWQPQTNQYIKGVETRTLRAPHAFRLVWFLCSEIGLSESDALNFPMARASIYYATAADKRGEIELESEADRELIRRRDELEAKIQRGEIKWPSD